MYEFANCKLGVPKGTYQAAAQVVFRTGCDYCPRNGKPLPSTLQATLDSANAPFLRLSYYYYYDTYYCYYYH